MQVLFTTASQMLFLALCILAGYAISIYKLLPDNSAATLAKLENIIFIPALILGTFIDKCSLTNLKQASHSLVVSLSILLTTIAISFVLSRFLANSSYEEKLFRYSLITPNYNFMGTALALGIFGESFLFDYIIFTIPLTIFTYTIGISWLKPSSSNNKIKDLFSPIFFSILLGIFLGISNISLPLFVTKSISALGGCMSPIAMLLTGIILGQFNIASLITKRRIYLLSAIRLLIIPIIFLLALNFLGMIKYMTLTACTLAMPLGLNTIIIPAAYEKDTSTGAAMTLISSIFSVVTIPLIFSLFF